MANPALKNGYLSIATELVEIFARHNIPGEEMRIIWVVLRKTWGWKQGDRKKDWDRIPLSQFAKYTTIKRSNCISVIKSLVSKRILLRGEKGYRFNQNYEEWVVSKRILGVSKRIPLLVSKRIPSIDSIKDNKVANARHNKIMDNEEKVIDARTGEIRRELPRANPSVINLIRWGEAQLGKNFVSFGKQTKNISQMVRAGYTAEQIKECWLNLEMDKFWGQNGIDFGVVASQIAKQKEVKYNPMLYEPTSRK